MWGFWSPDQAAEAAEGKTHTHKKKKKNIYIYIYDWKIYGFRLRFSLKPIHLFQVKFVTCNDLSTPGEPLFFGQASP